ncbi:uncharacterized protein LOC143280325 [Babylonia areolata]|uniref:uncharacterized protein LOC143280325 n=1 Tax=Babylonia areolata TaxID=304850 RepID=UPI003FD19782
MASRTEKDRAKAQQDKFQAILSSLLKDEDNKYCEDCDAKGPRWASWNLGVFLCIRCAGIHRNLGVHISRVKSVNLDSWTPEQVAMMQEMGNSRARAVYEANVQDSFRRPQTDSALEAFIRAKYEQKKYIAKEWIPPKPVVPKEWLEDDKADKKKTRNKPTSNISLGSVPPSSSSSSLASTESRASAKPIPSSVAAAEPKPAQPPAPKPKSSSDDLLGLDFSFNDTSKTEVPQSGGGGGGGQGGDLLADIFGGSQTAPATQGGAGQQNFMTAQQNGSSEPNLFESGGDSQGEKKSAKDSIMALYGSGGGQQQMFGVPGYYFGTDMTPNGDMIPPNSGFVASPFVSMMASNQGLPAFDGSHMAPSPGMMTLNTGMINAFSGIDCGLAGPNTGMMTTNTGVRPEMMSANLGTNMAVSSSFQSPMSGNTAMVTRANAVSKTAMFSMQSGMSQQPKLPQSVGMNKTTGITQSAALTTERAVLSSNTRSVASHLRGMPTIRTEGAGAMTNPGMCTGGDFYQPCLPNMYYYPMAGNPTFLCKLFCFGDTMGCLSSACGKSCPGLATEILHGACLGMLRGFRDPFILVLFCFVPPSSSSSSLASTESRASAKPIPSSVAAAEPKPAQPPAPKPKSSSDDLLGLDFSFNDTSKTEVPQSGGGGGGGQGGDLLADIFGGSQTAPATQGGAGQQNFMTAQQNGSSEPNLFESGGDSQGEKKSAKDSIMALYGSGGGQQQMFGVPGGMYMPQQQMYGAAGMQPMVQPQPGMMGVQQGMMGQPVQQGLMGMQQQPQQQPGAMFGNAGQMGQNQMAGGMMGGAHGGMMGRPGSQMYMQQQPQQQQMNPMQQQMQFQQMQQQMANMTMGGGGQMGGLQSSQQAAVGGGASWGGGAGGTGQTLSTNLWQ